MWTKVRLDPLFTTDVKWTRGETILVLEKKWDDFLYNPE